MTLFIVNCHDLQVREKRRLLPDLGLRNSGLPATSIQQNLEFHRPKNNPAHSNHKNRHPVPQGIPPIISSTPRQVGIQLKYVFHGGPN